MQTCVHNRSTPGHKARGVCSASALTLVEMAVAVGIGSLVLLVVTFLSIHALRSFAAMGNYISLDARNRTALDRITRDIQQATNVISFHTDATARWIKFGLPSLDVPTVKYLWYADDQKLICEKPGQADQIYLTGCDEWNFAFYQGVPLPNSANVFRPATDSAGAPDPASCKLVEMSWKCSRSFLGKKWNTESVQTTRVMLRNKVLRSKD